MTATTMMTWRSAKVRMTMTMTTPRRSMNGEAVMTRSIVFEIWSGRVSSERERFDGEICQ